MWVVFIWDLLRLIEFHYGKYFWKNNISCSMTTFLSRNDKCSFSTRTKCSSIKCRFWTTFSSRVWINVVINKLLTIVLIIIRCSLITIRKAASSRYWTIVRIILRDAEIAIGREWMRVWSECRLADPDSADSAESARASEQLNCRHEEHWSSRPPPAASRQPLAPSVSLPSAIKSFYLQSCEVNACEERERP